jgi:flagellar hook-associated protein 1 FlgK
MGLSASLAIATSGLSAVQSEMAVASQNIANATTAGYAVEQSSLSSRTAGGQVSGVVVGLTGRTIDTALENSLYAQNATVSALTTTTSALTTISALQGSTSADSGSSATLSDQVGNLQASLISLDSNPGSSVQQQAVITAAGALTSTINSTAATYQTARQAAQESIIDEVGTANSGLQLIGSLSVQITQGRANGISTVDLENQRSAAMTSLSNVLSVRFKETSTGDMLVSTANGVSLPTHAASGPLATSDATIDASDAYPNSIPAITLNGRDVTPSLTGGTLGANITLRDQTLPTMQAELDSFSQTLASRFDSAGVALFTDGSGTVAGSSPMQGSPVGQLGFSGSIQVSSTITSDPSGMSDTTLIDGLLDNALGTVDKAGNTQTSVTTGLGANGTLSAPYSGSSLTSSQASTIGQAASNLTNETAVQTALTTKVASVSGVSVDNEMASIVSLQNAYAANAKIVTAVQTMFSALLAAIS